MQEADKKKQEIDRMIAEVANEDGTIAAKDFFNLCKKVFKEDIDTMDEALAKAACDDDERAEENNC